MTNIYSGRDEGHHNSVALVMNDKSGKCMMKGNRQDQQRKVLLEVREEDGYSVLQSHEWR